MSPDEICELPKSFVFRPPFSMRLIWAGTSVLCIVFATLPWWNLPNLFQKIEWPALMLMLTWSGIPGWVSLWLLMKAFQKSRLSFVGDCLQRESNLTTRRQQRLRCDKIFLLQQTGSRRSDCWALYLETDSTRIWLTDQYHCDRFLPLCDWLRYHSQATLVR